MLPRVRTYHTRKPSRFVHALSARPLKVHWRGLTHMRSMCVNSLDDPRGRGEHCSPAKNHKVTFLLSRFLVTKSAAKVIKESVPLSLRALPPPVSATPTNALRALVNSRGVHELVARAMRGKCVRHGAEQKSVVLPLPVILAIPRVRTYHTKKPSRFVHALSARPHNKVGGD